MLFNNHVSCLPPPEIIALAIATCAIIGAGIELLNWYHRKPDADHPAKRPTPPRR